MSEPTTSPRRNPVRVVIIGLALVLLGMGAVVALLMWRPNTTTVVESPSPSPSPSASRTPTAPAPPSSPAHTDTPTPTATATATPPGTTAPATSAPVSSPASTQSGRPVESAKSSEKATPAASSAAPAQTMMWQGKATFDHVTVEVLQDDPNQDEMLEGRTGLLVEVCATGDTDAAAVSTRAWTLEDSNGNVQRPQPDGYRPAYPAEGDPAAGTCTSGYLTFDYLPVDTDYGNLVYDSGRGDRAVWQFH